MTDTINDIWLDRRVKIGHESAAELAYKFNEANWRGHPAEQAAALDESLSALRWIGSVKLNIQTGRIFDGHLRVRRAMVKDPAMLIPVDYYDLTPDEEALALQIHDAITEQAEPIADKLAALLERTREMTADRPGLGAMLQKLKERAGINGHQKTEEGPPPIDKAAELQKVWGVQVGDVWELGQHRLVCGDCTDRATVEAVMNKERAALCVTDPPYGVDYDPSWRGEDLGQTVHGKKIANDDSFDWIKTFAFVPADVLYVWLASYWLATVQMGIESHGFITKYLIVWNKDLAVFGRGDYHWKHEPCLYLIRKGENHHWQGARNESTVWDIPTIHSFANGHNAEEWGLLGHGNQKPIECMARPIRNNSAESELIYDPFLGSGTTLIAAHQLNRRCFGIEIEPSYCAVTLERWSTLTGQTPRRVSG